MKQLKIVSKLAINTRFLWDVKYFLLVILSSLYISADMISSFITSYL